MPTDADGWHSALTYDHFRADPEAGRLYGEFAFWNMHHDGTPEQKGNIDPLDAALVDKGFNQWGVYVDLWPEAAEAYLRLCRTHGVTPEAVQEPRSPA